MSDKYNEFKNLLRRFVEQANKKMKSGKGTNTKLGNHGFENNNYKNYQRSEEITIDNVLYKIQMSSSGHWGPKNGNGGQKLPYFGYELNSDFWVNVRVKFENFEVKTLKIVKWNAHTKKDVETILEADISDLNLNSTAISNEGFKDFYDKFVSFKKGNKKEQNVVEESLSSYIYDSKYALILRKSKNLILRGAPGTGKTYFARQIAEELTGGNDDQIGFVQFHPSYDYTDFVEGLRPVSSADGQIGFELQDGIFKEFCTKAKENSSKDFVFIIDEINRGEISKIFGELFFSIDPGYRGEKGTVSTQYANLHETDEKFYIPENIYIIGTMNDIDRSVDTFDFAMRRRFRFVEVTAEERADEMLSDEEVKDRLRQLNAAIEKNEELGQHYQIGPSYFMDLDKGEVTAAELWSDYLKPLLEDYLRGSYDEVEKLKELEKAYNSVEKEESDETDG
ncbi:McrB family protein [Streptococcus orisasini]